MTHSARRLVDDLLNVEVDIIVGDDIGPLADVATMSSVIDRYGTWLADHVPAIDARYRLGSGATSAVSYGVLREAFAWL